MIINFEGFACEQIFKKIRSEIPENFIIDYHVGVYGVYVVIKDYDLFKHFSEGKQIASVMKKYGKLSGDGWIIDDQCTVGLIKTGPSINSCDAPKNKLNLNLNRPNLPTNRNSETLNPFKDLAKCLAAAGVIERQGSNRTDIFKSNKDEEILIPVNRDNIAKNIDELLQLKDWDSLFYKIYTEKIELSHNLTIEVVKSFPNKGAINLWNYLIENRPNNIMKTGFIIPGETKSQHQARRLREINDYCSGKGNLLSSKKVDYKSKNFDYELLRQLFSKTNDEAIYIQNLFNAEVDTTKKEFEKHFYSLEQLVIKINDLEKWLFKTQQIEDYLTCKAVVKEYPHFIGNESQWPSGLDPNLCQNKVALYEANLKIYKSSIQELQESFLQFKDVESKYFNLLSIQSGALGRPSLEEISKLKEKSMNRLGNLFIENKNELSNLSKSLMSVIGSDSKNSLSHLLKIQDKFFNQYFNLKKSQFENLTKTFKQYPEVFSDRSIVLMELEEAKNGNKAFFGDIGRLFEKIGKKIESEVRRVRDRIKNDGLLKAMVHQVKSHVKLIEDWSLDVVEASFCPKDKYGKGWCFETGDKMITCKWTQNPDGSYQSCEITDLSGRSSGPGRQVEQMDWNAALSWLKKTEMQDFLSNMESQMSLELQRAMFNNPKQKEQFQRILAENQRDILDLTNNGTKIPDDPNERALLLERINSTNQILSFLKGLGNGSIANLKDSVLGLINFASNLDSAAAGISALVNMIFESGFEQIGDSFYSALGNYYNDYQQASIERKGEIVGYAIAEAFTLFYGGALTKSALEAIKVASVGSKGALLFENIVDSARKYGFKKAPDIKKLATSMDDVVEQGFSKVLHPRGKGASSLPVPEGHVKVSRWVDDAEVKPWFDGGGTRIPSEIGANQRLYVTLPGAPKPGGTGPVRIDFFVPEKMLQKAGTSEWRQILQPQANSPIYNVEIFIP